MAAASSWKGTLLKAFAPLAAVLAYYVWRKGTAFTHSGRFRSVQLPEPGDVLAS